MAEGGRQTFLIGDVLDKLERVTREVGKSLDPMRGSLDLGRLGRARDTLGGVLEELDALLGRR